MNATKVLQLNYGHSSRNYEAGEWEVARDQLQMTVTLVGEVDGPSAALLGYMKTFDYTAPK
jgi:hypothetical protein